MFNNLDMLDLFHMLDAPDTFYMLVTFHLLPGWVRAQHGSWLLAVQGPADQVGVDVWLECMAVNICSGRW